MSRTKPTGYRRCSGCKELIAERHDDCPNCAARNPLSASKPRNYFDGKRGSPTLDIQEGNWE